MIKINNEKVINLIKSTSINILYYGVVTDGVTDQSSKMQDIINGLAFDNTPKIICIPQGCKLKADFVIDKPFVTLTGGGTIKGKVTIDVRNSYANVVVDNIFTIYILYFPFLCCIFTEFIRRNNL